MKVTTAIKNILSWIANPDIGNQLGRAELKRIKDGRLGTRLTDLKIPPTR